MSKYSRELSVAAVLGLLLIALAVFAPNSSSRSRCSRAWPRRCPRSWPPSGWLASSISRQIDISIGAQFGMCAVVAGLLAAAKLPLVVVISARWGLAWRWALSMDCSSRGLGCHPLSSRWPPWLPWQETLRLWQQGRLLNLPPGLQCSASVRRAARSCSSLSPSALVALATWALKTRGRRPFHLRRRLRRGSGAPSPASSHAG